MDKRKTEAEIFAENLRFLRIVYRLSQKELAKIMDVSVYCVRKAESGVFANSLHIDALVYLSNFFHLPCALFFTPLAQWGISFPIKGTAAERSCD